jgi:hypothetical protein
MRRSIWLAGCVATVLLSGSALIAATLDYQGRITTAGEDFSGQGHFKFLLHDGNGHALWSNDGSVGMDEPKEAVAVAVKEGLFAVQLGDVAAGMQGISPLAFHVGTLQLRTWFSAAAEGGFELLKPDVAVHPLDFAHLATGGLLIVDANGSADFADLQQAVNVAAANPAYSAVLIMPGRYRLIEPLKVPDGASLLIKGLAPEWVEIERAGGAAVVPFSGAIEGVTVRGNPAVDDAAASQGYNFKLRGCRVESTGRAEACVKLSKAGQFRAERTEFSGSVSGIVLDGFGGGAEIADCTVKAAGGAGVAIAKGGATGRLLATESHIEGTPGIELSGGDVGQTVVPELIGCRIQAPRGGPTVGLTSGASSGAIRMVNTVLSAEPAEGVQLLPPAKELAYGNVVIGE